MVLRGIEAWLRFVALFLAFVSYSSAFRFGGKLLPRKQGKEDTLQSMLGELVDAGECLPGSYCKEGEWERVAEGEAVRIWKMKVLDSPYVAIKARATMAVSPQALYDCLNPGNNPEIVRKYNPMIGEGRDLVRLDKDTKISWSTSIAIWPSRPRDFVTLIKKVKLADGSIALINKAVDHPDAPPTDEYVRGEIVSGLFLIKPIPGTPDRSEFTMVHHFNPGGHIPAWLMNWLAEIKPISFVQRLEAVAQELQLQLQQQQSQNSGNGPSNGRRGGSKPFSARSRSRPQRPGSCQQTNNAADGSNGAATGALPTTCGFLAGDHGISSIWSLLEGRGANTLLAIVTLAAAVAACLTKRRGHTWESVCVHCRMARLGSKNRLTTANTSAREVASGSAGEEEVGSLDGCGAAAAAAAAANAASCVVVLQEVSGEGADVAAAEKRQQAREGEEESSKASTAAAAAAVAEAEAAEKAKQQAEAEAAAAAAAKSSAADAAAEAEMESCGKGENAADDAVDAMTPIVSDSENEAADPPAAAVCES